MDQSSHVSTLRASQLIAHRGHQSLFPENSLIAILGAIDAGAIHIEFDIQITADYVPVLYHDESMLRASGVDINLTSLQFQQLSEYSLYEPERLGTRFKNNPITSLHDFMKVVLQHEEINFYMELKEESIGRFGLAQCFEAIANACELFPPNLWLISFDIEAVKQAKNIGFNKTAIVFRDWLNRDAIIEDTKADLGFMNCQRIPSSAEIIACKPLALYEVADKHLAKDLLSRGAYLIETFCIGELLGDNT